MMDYVWLIPLFPLIGFLINGLVGKSLPKSVVGTIGSAAVGLSFLLTVAIFLEFLKLPEGVHAVEKVMYTWIASGPFTVSVAFLIDPLSLIMLLVVSGVSTLIHIYSIGYMHDDEGFYRYFAYLNLFVFAMLHPGERQQLPPDVRGLGRCRSLFLSAHRVLVRKEVGLATRARKPLWSTGSATSASCWASS